MLKNWLWPGQKSEPAPPTEPKAPWFMFKVGGFKLEADKEAMLAINPVLPIIVRFAVRAAVVGTAFWSGMGAANMDSKLCNQPADPAAPVIEDVAPQK